MVIKLLAQSADILSSSLSRNSRRALVIASMKSMGLLPPFFGFFAFRDISTSKKDNTSSFIFNYRKNSPKPNS